MGAGQGNELLDSIQEWHFLHKVNNHQSFRVCSAPRSNTVPTKETPHLITENSFPVSGKPFVSPTSTNSNDHA